MSERGDGSGEQPFDGWFRPDGTGPDGPRSHRRSSRVELPPELSPRGGKGARRRGRTRSGPSREGAPSARAVGPTRSRTRTFFRRLTAVAAAMVVLASGTGYALTKHYLGDITRIDVFDGLVDRPDKLDVAAQNILVAGVDDRDTLTPAERKKYRAGNDDYGKRSDTMILFHVSHESRSISAISFPRDSFVTIPSYTDANGNVRPESRNKLNAAYAFGGESLLVATIEQATGIRIDHYVEVDLQGFVRMVDAVGNVEVCVPEAVSDRDSGLNLPAGRSELDGAEALAFVRARKIYADSDLGRIRAQQRFIGSMIKKVTSTGVLLNPVRLNRLLSAVVQSLKTDMSEDQIIAQAQRLRDYDPSDIEFHTVPISDPNVRTDVGLVVVWDEVEAQAMFERVRRDEGAAAPKPPKVTVAPGSITLQVLNGAGIQGLAGRTADELAGLGFGMAGPAGNAPTSDNVQTVVRHSPEQAEAARTVLAAIPGSVAEEVVGLGSTIEVVVGSSYDGVKSVSIAGATPRSDAPKPRTAADDVCA